MILPFGHQTLEFAVLLLQFLKAFSLVHFQEMFPFRKTPFDAMASDNAADRIMLGLAEQLGNYRKAKAIASNGVFLKGNISNPRDLIILKMDSKKSF